MQRAALTVCVALALAACSAGDDETARPYVPSSTDLPPAASATLVDSTRFPRLTHDQWENTVRDLLRLPERPGLAPTFTTDPPGSTFGNDGELLQVTPGLWQDYQRAAETLAAKVARDPAALARIAPAGTGTDRARAFVADLGARAYRRPLRPPEIDSLAALFARGRELVGGTDDFAAGAEVLLRTLLQSPSFMVRLELGEAPKNGVVRLTPHELASRLSYAVWNSMPDDGLFAAAGDGSLGRAEALAAQASRMLDDPRAEPVLMAFHEKLFRVEAVDGIKKDAALFPEWSDDMAKLMRTEFALFVKDVVTVQGKGLTELLTADYTFADQKIAAIYGVTKPGGDFARVKLDGTQRAGILTQSAFLAAFASSRQTDPIHRGVVVNFQVLCSNMPPPPMNVPPLPPAVEGETMRERVTRHTGAGTCGAGCHGTMINPAGFAFERYDALGKWRTTDNGKPVDSADRMTFTDGAASFDGAVEFAKLIAGKGQVHECYAKNLLEYSLGRRRAAPDKALVEAVGKASLEGGSTKKLLLALVTSPTFAFRPAPEGH